MDIVTFFWKVIETMIPPVSADDKIQWMYRLRLTIVACAAFCGFIGLTVASFGITPWFDGFARTSALNSLSEEVLDNELLNLREHHCVAATWETKELYWVHIEHLTHEYRKITGREYLLAPCDAL